MASDIKRTSTPKLRFPEFRKTGAWTEKSIGEISASVIAGGTPNTSEKSYWNGNVRWMTSGDLNLKTVYEVEGRITADGLQNSSTKLIPSHCVLIGLAGQGKTRGTVAMNMVELCTNQSIAAIFPNESAFVSKFLYHNLESRYDELRRLSANGEGRGGLNLQIIKSLKVSLPERREQQKIAACLTSLDEVIAAQWRKVEALKAHKKGLMQQLFPRERETLPRFRFPRFSNAPEWKQQLVSTILKRASNPVDVDPDQMYQQIGIRSHGNGVFHKDPVSGKELGNKRVFWVEEDAFVVNIIFAWEQAVATTSPAEKGMIGSHRFPMYKAKDGKADVRFLKFFFLTPQGKAVLGVASPGGAGRNKTLGQKEFENIKLVVPEDVAEQGVIADCLCNADNLIKVNVRTLEALKAHKTGLMRQLFPSPEGD